MSIRTTPTPPSTRTGIMDRLEGGGRSNVGRGSHLSCPCFTLSLSPTVTPTQPIYSIFQRLEGEGPGKCSVISCVIFKEALWRFSRVPPSCSGAWVVGWRTYSLRYGTARAVFDKIIFRRNSPSSSVSSVARCSGS